MMKLIPVKGGMFSCGWPPPVAPMLVDESSARLAPAAELKMCVAEHVLSVPESTLPPGELCPEVCEVAARNA
jgi:hypothetical protein